MGKSSLFQTTLRLIKLAQIADRNRLSTQQLLEKINSNKTLSRRTLIRGATTGLAVFPFSKLYASEVEKTPHHSLTHTSPVFILGAGLSGLVAAYRLHQARLPTVIYEASHRVGGRMFTLNHFNSDRMFCELGGEFVDSSHDDLIQLSAEVGIQLQDLKKDDLGLETDLFYVNDQVINSKQMLTGFEPLAKKLNQDLDLIFSSGQVRVPTYRDYQNPIILKYDRMSLEDYLCSMKDTEKWVRDLISVLYICEFGLETGEQSALNFLTLISSDVNEGLKLLGESDERYRIPNGSSTLTHRLHKLISKSTPIHFQHRLVQIQDTWRGLKLTFLNHNTPVEVFAEQVVCTIPFSILRHIDGISKLHLHPRIIQSIQKFGYGTNTKVMMNFNQRVWRKSIDHASNGSLLTTSSQQFWETSRGQTGDNGILTQFLGGRMGETLPSHHLKNTLSLLDTIFTGSQNHFSNETVTMNWAKAKWAKGSFTCFKPGQYTTFNGIAAHPQLSGRLIFAGEHTCETDSGFMNGAVQSGNRAAENVLATQNKRYKIRELV